MKTSNDLSVAYSITAESCRDWIRRNEIKLRDYLRQFHDERDWVTVTNLLFWYFPEEGKKIIENFDKTDDEKKTRRGYVFY